MSHGTQHVYNKVDVAHQLEGSCQKKLKQESTGIEYDMSEGTDKYFCNSGT
jgi:hypothetical protein